MLVYNNTIETIAKIQYQLFYFESLNGRFKGPYSSYETCCIRDFILSEFRLRPSRCTNVMLGHYNFDSESSEN